MKINENAMWEKCLKYMPRGTQTMSKCPDQFVDGVYPKFVSKAKGAYIYDLNGKKYLDYMCGLGPIILGYNDKVVNDAIKKQLKKGIIFPLPSTLECELAEMLIDIIPCAEQVRFGKNGSDVTLAAVRIARSHSKKEKILKCGYHGWGDWHGITVRPYGIPSCLKDVIDEFKYNDLTDLETKLAKKDVAAVIMEVQALTKPENGFLEGVRKLCNEYNTILIFDEIVTGFRWDLGGAQKYFGVTPDLACFGKAMANGLPIGAILGKKELMQELNHAFFSMTFGGECLSLAASIATIKELKKKNYRYIWKLGNMFGDGINDAAVAHGLKINFAGSAPRHNLTFSPEYSDATGMKDLFYQEMIRQGIFFSNVLYIQFSHTEKQIKQTVDAAYEAFKTVAKNQNDIGKVLRGKRSVEVFRKNT